MSQSEIKMTAQILSGEISMQEGNGRLNTPASGYIILTIYNTEFQRQVRAAVGERFDELLRMRARQMAPLTLEVLRRDVVFATTSHVSFLAIGLPLLGIPTEEFITISELGALRRQAHLRSAKYASTRIHDPQYSVYGIVASAVLADVSVEEIGVTQADADKCIDQYFGRNDPDRKLAWEAIKVEYKELNAIFA